MVNKRPDAFYEDLVNSINELNGAHPGYRAAHAKGIYCRGTFEPTPGAVRLSRAAHFKSGRIPVTARFSNGGGNPNTGDNEPDARGLAIKFALPGGGSTDLVAITLPMFLVKNAEDFVAFTRARVPDPVTKAPDPAKMGAFLANHPETRNALQALGTVPPAKSYAEATYNSIHAFILRNAEDVATNARYRIVPVDADKNRPPSFPPESSADMLQNELKSRLATKKALFDLVYVLGQAGDSTTDPTVAWPADRPTLVAGRIELTEVLPSKTGAADTVIFDPNNVTDGIACSDDDILHTRGAAYSVSYTRRTKA